MYGRTAALPNTYATRGSKLKLLLVWLDAVGSGTAWPGGAFTVWLVPFDDV